MLLEKAASYCRRLEASVLDFVCREEVEEEVNGALDDLKVAAAPLPTWALPKGAPAMAVRRDETYRFSCVYDYQYVRAEGRVKERRILLLRNGKKKNEPDAPLLISSLAYRNAMLGPVNLFAERTQKLYDFKITGRGKFEKRPVVVETIPKADVVEPLCLTGKAWLDPLSGDVLRIEWTQKPSAHPEIFEDRARRAKGRLRLTVRTEFSEEKNGLRFPSRIWIQEAYVRERGRAFIRSETDVVYKDFKFFTVETEVGRRDPGRVPSGFRGY